MTAIAKIRSTFPLAPLSLEEAVEQIADLAGQREKLLAALKKLKSYNEDILAGRINYRPEDHIAVAEAAIQQAEKAEG